MKAFPPNFPKNEFITLCQRLIQTPSVNGQDAELQMAETVADFAKRHDLQAEIVAREPARPNVIVQVGPPEIPGLLLIAHLDTVPAGEVSGWTFSPFAGTIEGDRLYGRGAIDNKGGLVAALGALCLLKAREGQLTMPVALIGVPDEEAGATGRLGIRFLHETGRLRGLGAIYTYSGTEKIVIGHRGVWRLKVVVHGKAIHTGSREWQSLPPGYNAIAGMAAFLAKLPCLNQTFPFGEGWFLAHKTVITPTVIQGGTSPGMVPERCEAILDIRLIPSTPKAEVEVAFQQLVAQVSQEISPFQMEFITESFIPPTLIPETTPMVQQLFATVQKVKGLSVPFRVSGPANEAYLLNEIGIPTCIYGPDGKNAHAADEYVQISSLFEVMQIYAQTALELQSFPLNFAKQG